LRGAGGCAPRARDAVGGIRGAMMPMRRPSRPFRFTRAAAGVAAAAALVLVAGRAFLVGQEPQAPPGTPTFRVGTRLATIDAVVVDKDGQHVTDLEPGDFEVVERGKTQP